MDRLTGMKLVHAVLLLLFAAPAVAGPALRVPPYVQNPASDAMTVTWFTNDGAPGRLQVREDGEAGRVLLDAATTPTEVPALAYTAFERKSFFANRAPRPPWRHRVRITGLQPATTYRYVVLHGATRVEGAFSTAPGRDRPIRFAVSADMEAEPESTGVAVAWPAAGGPSERSYLVDQTTGVAANLRTIAARKPAFLALAGDLVQVGGEQRDWDELWRHLGGLAGGVPVLAVPGNHEYWAGPQGHHFDQPFAEQAVARFLAYFEVPDNGAPDRRQAGRYWRLDYGPVTLVALDVNNNGKHGSAGDTSHYMRGESDPGGGAAPDFGPGSRQYRWLERELADARAKSRFTFVLLHHTPYTSGLHGLPAGRRREGLDGQSAVPVRGLVPLLHRYAVDAVFGGHDEMLERSEVKGTQRLPSGESRPHTLQVWDVGIAGDGLRGPHPGVDNPQRRFLAHVGSPERWEGGLLVDGGKHYGHLEVDVARGPDGVWQARVEPVYVFPVMGQGGSVVRFERRVYPDVVVLRER